MFEVFSSLVLTNATTNSSSWQHDAIVNGNRVSASLSLLGSIIVILTFLGLPGVRRPFVKFAFCLSLADLGQEIALLFGLPEPGLVCVVQGFMIGYFTSSTIFCASHCTHAADPVALTTVFTTGPFLMAITLAILVLKHDSNPEKYSWVFQLIGWGLPAILATLPFATSLEIYAQAGILYVVRRLFAFGHCCSLIFCSLSLSFVGFSCIDRCWLNGEVRGGDAWRIGQVYGWVWFVFLSLCVIYAVIACRVRQSANLLAGVKTRSGGAHGEIFRLIIYPINLMISYLFASIDRVQNMVDPHNPIFWLQMTHIVLVSLCGFLNALAFMTAPSVRHEVRMLLLRCGCLRPKFGARPVSSSFGSDLDAVRLQLDSASSLTEPLASSVVSTPPIMARSPGKSSMRY